MRKNIKYAALCFVALAALSCQKEGVQGPEIVENSGGFDFSTTKTYDLTVDYNLAGYVRGINFDVFGEDPYREATDETGVPVLVRDENVKPLGGGVTTAGGHYSGRISLPTWVETIYITTDDHVAHDFVAASVAGTAIKADIDRLAALAVTRSAATRAAHTVPAGYYTLGDWDDTGLPAYITSETVPAGLSSDVKKILKANTSLPANFPYLVSDEPGQYKNHNLSLAEAGEVELVFLSSSASLHSAVGYYHYETANPPANPAAITRKTIIFPHASGTGHPLKTGDKVQLKYWNGAEYVDRFPAGTTIGFVLLPGTFTTSTGNIGKMMQGYEGYSDAAFNMYGAAADENRRQQSVALYNAPREVVVIGFEDRIRGIKSVYNDHDFDDLIFYTRVTPYTSIDVPGDHKPDDLDPNTPAPDPKPYVVEYSGTLAFEDLWPSMGDYDMNDVGLTYDCKVYYNTDNKVIKVEDTFRAVRKGAKYTNGFGYQYGVPASAVKSVTVKSTPEKALPNNGAFEAGQALATLILFNDAEKEVSGPTFLYPGKTGEQKGAYEYSVTTEFTTPQDIAAIGFPPYNPFLVIDQSKLFSTADKRGLELHLTNYAPTTLANPYFFGRNDDRSDASVPRWYISKALFPWAINIPTKQFTFPAEGVRIDAVYPGFRGWVLSNGAQNADWYKL